MNSAAVFLSSFLAVVGPQIVQPLATAKPVSCSVPKTCAIFTNSSTGSAIHATSAGGAALLATSSSGNDLAPPVDGESTNPSGNDAGGGFGLDFLATNNAPLYGALAFGSGDGLYGESEANGSGSGYAGVFGYDASGGNHYPDYNSGVTGQTTQGTGVLGMANGPPASSAYGYFNVGVYGVGEQGNSAAIGVFGESNNYPIYAVNTGANTFALLAYSNDLVFAESSNTGAIFEVSNTGDAYVSGTLRTSKGTYVRHAAADGMARRSYGAETTSPQIEDVGEAQLANGRAPVEIDGAFGATVDMRDGYHVFVTPEGDCKGLYVTQKSPTGFVVRELQGGRSTLAFDYRIVARPLHEDGTRLAVDPAPPSYHDAAVDAMRKHRHLAPFLTPEERLKARIGTQAYAEALLERRTRLTTK